jgi:hypothetical protein
LRTLIHTHITSTGPAADITTILGADVQPYPPVALVIVKRIRFNKIITAIQI